MNPGEHAVMARIEADYWWYLALRDLIARLLEHARPALPEHPRVLDAGCGTGGNLVFLAQELSPSHLAGFDLSEEAVAFSQQRVPDADVYQSDLCEPELHRAELDLITSLDVLYIPGIEAARPGLARLVSALRPGGRLVLNLPAFEWLRSEHDLAVHTSERYTRPQVTALLESLGLEVEVATYRLCFLFPVMLAARLPSMWRARGMAREDARSALHDSSGSFANRPLFEVMKLENRLIASGVTMPFGSSVFAVGRKPGVPTSD